MTRPARRHRPPGARPTAPGLRPGLALVLLALIALSAGAWRMTAAAAVAAANQSPARHASRPSHRGRCARRARPSGRSRHHCSTHRRAGATEPASALALTAPAGPSIQPLAPLAPAPPAVAPPGPATPAPAGEGATPGAGGGETSEGVEPPSIPHVQVSAVEYAFTLSRTSVPAGKVIFQFVNNGQDEHNLKIAPSEGPLAGSFANTPSKGVSDLQLEIQPGQYTLLCSLPTHEQKGMKATLTVVE
jgi:plastocyanin